MIEARDDTTQSSSHSRCSTSPNRRQSGRAIAVHCYLQTPSKISRFPCCIEEKHLCAYGGLGMHARIFVAHSAPTTTCKLHQNRCTLDLLRLVACSQSCCLLKSIIILFNSHQSAVKLDTLSSRCRTHRVHFVVELLAVEVVDGGVGLAVAPQLLELVDLLRGELTSAQQLVLRRRFDEPGKKGGQRHQSIRVPQRWVETHGKTQQVMLQFPRYLHESARFDEPEKRNVSTILSKVNLRY